MLTDCAAQPQLGTDSTHPKLTLTDMHNVLEKLRAGEPLTSEDKTVQVATRFDGAPAGRITELLETLATLGQAEQTEDGRFVAG